MYSYPDPSKINIREICDSRCSMSASAVDNEGESEPIELAIVPVGEEEIVALEVIGGSVDTGRIHLNCCGQIWGILAGNVWTGSREIHAYSCFLFLHYPA